jgi:hypothetical protein
VKLKRLLADAMLDQAALQDLLSKRTERVIPLVVMPDARREAVAHLQTCHGMSERRACRVIGADRKSVRYRSTRDDDAELREKLRELANQRRRFGYRPLDILLRREGVMINRKKTQRIYHEEPLGSSPAAAQPQEGRGDQSTCSGAGAAEPALEPRLRS